MLTCAPPLALNTGLSGGDDDAAKVKAGEKKHQINSWYSLLKVKLELDTEEGAIGDRDFGRGSSVKFVFCLSSSQEKTCSKFVKCFQQLISWRQQLHWLSTGRQWKPPVWSWPSWIVNVKDKPSLNKHLGEARSPCRSAADKLESAGADAECRVPVSALAVRAAWLQFLQLYRHYLPNHGRTVGTYRAGEIESSRGNLFICAELGLVKVLAIDKIQISGVKLQCECKLGHYDEMTCQIIMDKIHH